MANTSSSRKVLIFIVAYNAASHIRSVLDRLPAQVFNNSDFHVLIIDDCSKDETAKIASAHASQCGYRNITILRNTVNQGYGGNQKLGYRYAIQNNFGFVILLHGDGQYAPELVLEFVKHWKENQADVVLGSRMIDKSQARAGGMPFYKWIGNQILTFFQNNVVGSDLSEFHTGYRAYDTYFLSRVPFELNTNDFHFDTEILLQAFALKAKFAEFSIPTHYGDEVCHVNGIRYALDVAKACIKYRSQKIGFFCTMQYRGLLDFSERHQDPAQAASVHRYVLETIAGAKNILVLGDHADRLSLKLSALPELKSSIAHVDREKNLLQEKIFNFDKVVVLNLLEQLADAERFLINCRYGVEAKTPLFLFSSKNVAFLGLRLLLFMGLFNYGERGILTMGTKRLFTLSSFKRILRETGFQVGKVRGFGVPFYLLFSGRTGKFLTSISDWLAQFWPSLFAYQFVIEAKPEPHVYKILSTAERFYETKDYLSL